MDEILVEVTRGARVESRHAGAAVVCDEAGRVVFAAGDVEAAVYPRSAVKALLALPLVESGAADRLGLTDDEIALACSSHSGEPVHVAAASSMLRRVGRDAGCLECGAHWPTNAAASRALAAAGGEPSALHNNCSGKHAGFICLACDRGVDPAGYVEPGHPAMRAVTAALGEMVGIRLEGAPWAVDGCSIPTYAIPLRALAAGFARFGTGHGLDTDRARAARRIRAAVAAAPLMVAGTGRFDTRLMAALGNRVFSKGGAEGVFCASLPGQGLGLAVKVADGAGRAAEVATASLVARFLDRGDGGGDPGGDRGGELAALHSPSLSNWNGRTVGVMRAAEALRRN